MCGGRPCCADLLLTVLGQWLSHTLRVGCDVLVFLTGEKVVCCAIAGSVESGSLPALPYKVGTN